MASFGSFETDREVFPDHALYGARSRGPDRAGEFAVRLQPLELGAEETAAEAERRFQDSLALQKEVADRSRGVAPVYESGVDERGAWYVTGSYFSVDKLLAGRVQLTASALHHLVHAVVCAALDLRRLTGRSHGDLRPRNVLFARAGRLEKAAVFVTEPRPGTADDAPAIERSDLQAVGEIVFQLVHRRTIDAAYQVFPVQPSAEWSGTFGKQADRWVKLCNRLLDPELDLAQIDLEKLAAELEILRPKSAVSARAVLVAAAAMVVLAILVAAGWWIAMHGRLAVRTDPGDAVITVRVTGTVPTGRPSVWTNQPRKPFHLRLRKGVKVMVAANHPTLGERTVTAVVPQEVRIDYEYGTVIITARSARNQLLNASVVVNGVEIGTTPFTNGHPLPLGTKLSFGLKRQGYLPTNAEVTVGRGPNLTELVLQIEPEAPAEAVKATFVSEPPGARFRVTSNGMDLVSVGGGIIADLREQSASLLPGDYVVVAELKTRVATNVGWPSVSQTSRVSKGVAPAPLLFTFENAPVGWDPTPPEAKVFLLRGGSREPIDLTTASRRESQWPTGVFTFVFEAEGYLPSIVTITNTASGSNLTLNPRLQRDLAVLWFTNRQTDVSFRVLDTSTKSIVVPWTYGPVVSNAIGPDRGIDIEARFHGGNSAVMVRDGTCRHGINAFEVKMETHSVSLTSDPADGVVYHLLASGTNKLNPPISIPAANFWPTGTYDVSASGSVVADTPITRSIEVKPKGNVEAFAFPCILVAVSITPPTASIEVPTPYASNVTYRPTSKSIRVPLGTDRLTVIWEKVRRPVPITFEAGNRSRGFLSARQDRPETIANSLGMEFVYVPPPFDGYVGRFEVAKKDFLASKPARTVADRDRDAPNMPIRFVLWEEATNFVGWLRNDPNNRLPIAADYDLPTVQDFLNYLGSLEVGKALPPTQTGAVLRGSAQKIDAGRQSFNEHGIYDLIGNVGEMCRDGGEFVVMGGFPTPNQRLQVIFRTDRVSNIWRQTFKDNMALSTRYYATAAGNPWVGFRVIARPRP